MVYPFPFESQGLFLLFPLDKSLEGVFSLVFFFKNTFSILLSFPRISMFDFKEFSSLRVRYHLILLVLLLISGLRLIKNIYLLHRVFLQNAIFWIRIQI